MPFTVQDIFYSAAEEAMRSQYYQRNQSTVIPFLFPKLGIS